MVFDSHCHTVFSTDSRMTLDEAMEAAAAKEIGLIITEHMDYDYPQAEAFLFDPQEYLATYAPYRSEKLLLGVEIGMRAECKEANRKLIENHGFDQVIGSIHVVEGMDIYDAAFYKGRSKRDVYCRYFEAMLQCVEEYDFIDALGHIDYIARYARYEDPEVYYGEYMELIDAVLLVVAGRETALEINTRRLESPVRLRQLLPIYERFAALGGRFVTIGSDAHKPEDVGRWLRKGLAIAEFAGLQPVYYRERQRYGYDDKVLG